VAIFNEILVGRFSRSLQKLFGMKGGAAVRQLAGELTPVHKVFSGRENRYLESWATFGARVQQGAVAAQDTVARFTNPTGSNIIAIVESMKFGVSAAAEVVFEFSNLPQTNLAQLVGNANFDKRTNPADTGNNGSAGTLSAANNIGQIGVIFDDFTINGSSQELITHDDQHITVLPGCALQIRTLTLNVAITFTLRWRERFMEDSERV
jgi:hypothetical protein